MNNKNRSEILLKVIERLYQQYPDIQEFINFVIVDICRKENISPEKVFCTFRCRCLYHNKLLKKKFKQKR